MTTPQSARSALPATTVRAPSTRIVALDVLRGVALCGVEVVNVLPIAVASGTAAATGPSPGAGSQWLGLLAEQRFFPIFSLLFGISAAFVLRSAAARRPHPRRVLVRRFGVLLVLGLLHRILLWEGDVLAVYAVVGLLVLLPATWLSRWALVALSSALLSAALVAYGGGLMLVPGLFLLGAALVRFGVVDRLESGGRALVTVGALLAVIAAPAVWWQASTPDPGLPMGVAGLAMAGCYTCGVLLAMRTPARTALTAIFAPFGRMALTNYLTATVLVLVVACVVGAPEGWSSARALAVAASVLLLQVTWSRLWLRRFRQGPLEWCWRWVTWLERPPLLCARVPPRADDPAAP